MAIVSTELAVLVDIPLGIWVVVLPGPFDCVSHCLHDCYTLDGLYIEVVLRNPSSVSLGEWVFIGPHGWLIERMTIVMSRSAMRKGMSRAQLSVM